MKTELKVEQAGGFLPVNCYQCHHQEIDCHWHEEIEILCVERGKLQIKAGQQVFDGEAGDLFVFAPGELHAAVPKEETCEFRVMVFSPEILCGSQGDCIRLQYVAPIVGGTLVLPTRISLVEPDGIEIYECLKKIFELVEEHPVCYELLVKAQLLELFARILPKSHRIAPSNGARESTASKIKKSIVYIQEHFASPITLKELADICGMSEGHFCRTFKQYTMKTPIQYINSVRLSHAMELLLKTDRKIAEIAIDTGFRSQSYFVAFFREMVGITPSVYRSDIGTYRWMDSSK